jgi:hypothetical protein
MEFSFSNWIISKFGQWLLYAKLVDIRNFIFETLEEAKHRIKSHKIERKDETWPYIIIQYENNVGKIAYVEYAEYCFTEGFINLIK